MNTKDREFIVQKIRTQYMEKSTEQNQLDLLRELDAEVKRPANIFGYVFGSIGAIIMGAGMSLVMTDIGAQLGIGDGMVPGIIVGIAGMLMTLVNYPIYSNILASRKEKYAERILKLSDKIMTEE